MTIAATAAPGRVVVTHWANGHMMDSETLFPDFANEFNAADIRTGSGKRVEVKLFRANSAEISGDLISRIAYGIAIDRTKPNPTIVTPAADHWVRGVNSALGKEALDLAGVETVATTYIGIVTSREMAQCLGWPAREIGFADVVSLATDPQGWTSYACARPEWGREALLAFTFPSRSSTARSVLFALYAIAAGKPVEQLTSEDVTRPEVIAYINKFHSAIDCWAPDTLDLNARILTNPPCAHFFFIAEDNLVQLYQGTAGKHLESDMVMIYPKEGSITHNHSAFVVNADFVSQAQTEAAAVWTRFLKQEPQQQAFMQAGFRRTTVGICVNPLGSPFSPCSSSPRSLLKSDKIDPAAMEIILRTWE